MNNRSEQGNSNLSLWDQAFEALSEEDKKHLRSYRGEVRPKHFEVLQVVENQISECKKKQWVLYTNNSGERVLVRDTLSKVSDWLEKFKNVGDAAVQFDPSHATLPWMAVKAILQITVNDCQTFGNMLEGIESVSNIVARYTELETRVLLRTSNLTKQLSVALVKLYSSTLKFLAHASQYYGRNTAKRLVKSIWNSSKSYVEEPILQIEKQEDDVHKLVSLVQFEIGGFKLDDILKSIQQSVANSHDSFDERRRRLAAWIGGIETKNTYETALKYHHHGTCQWVLELPELCFWNTDQNASLNPKPRLLWIHGPAGFGKTILSAWLIQHLVEQKKAPLSYFFCVADNQLTRDPYAILRSWLAQILDQDDRVVSIMNTVYKARNNEKTLTQQGLWELFAAVGTAIEGCTFIIDGFDECTDIDAGTHYHRSDPRNSFLQELLKNMKPTSRVLVVSRDVPDIRTCLGKENNMDSGVDRLEYSITSRDTSEDVLAFSESVVKRKLEGKKFKSETSRQNIAKQAAARSEGMFLWIKLLEQKISPGQNEKQLFKTVTEMPSGISEAYSRELENIVRLTPEEKAKAVMILRWTLFAVRPLQVKQLAEALIVSDDHLEEYPEDDLPDSWNDGFVDEYYVKEVILGRCGSLLQLRSTSADIPLADHTVHFVHFSVKEYLLEISSHAGANQWTNELGLSDPSEEELRLSKICLRYLTLKTFAETPQNIEMYPFLSYAAWAWYFHSYHEKPAPSQDIVRHTQEAFDPRTSGWKVWTPLMEAELVEPDFQETDSEILSVISLISEQPSFENVQSPMYYASLLGLIDVAKWLETQGLDYSCTSGRFGCPLQAAIVRKHEDLVMYLLSRRVDVHRKSGKFGAPIIAAAATSTLKIVQALLNANASVTINDEHGWTALHHAAKRGSVDIVQELLARGSDIDALTATGESAAWVACFHEQNDVLSLLARSGANLNLVGKTSTSPLQVAIRINSTEAVDILFKYGLSPDTLFSDTIVALSYACYCSSGMVKKLLDQGADPNSTDPAKWRPLDHAAACGDLEIVKTLVARGAKILDDTDSTEHEISPLLAAVANRNYDVANFLFENGVDLDQKTKYDATAILLAAENRDSIMVEWLLDKGASMQGTFEQTQESLFDLSRAVSLKELLVRRGCFQVQASGSDIKVKAYAKIKALSDSSFAMLAYHGDLERIKASLADAAGKVTAHDLTEALQVAAAVGHLSIVKFLLLQPVRVNLLDMNGRTALHHATMNRHFEVAEVLVDFGASVSIEDHMGSTPLDLAISHGQRATDFIRKNMDSLVRNVSRRPSILATTLNQPGNLTIMAVRRAITGFWVGHYEYLSWQENRKDPFSIDVPTEALQALQPSAFSNEGEDEVGRFHFHGFIDAVGDVWFVKLYDGLGWLYRGQVNSEKGVLKGTWGRNRKLWFGTFALQKSEGKST